MSFFVIIYYLILKAEDNGKTVPAMEYVPLQQSKGKGFQHMHINEGVGIKQTVQNSELICRCLMCL